MNALSGDQLHRYWEEGYLVVDGVVDVAQYLDPMVEEYAQRLDILAHDLYAEGRLSSTYDGLPFGPKLTRVYAETSEDWAQYFDFTLPLKADLRSDEPCFFSPAVFDMLRNPSLLDIVECLIGPEIYSNPVQHVRIKPPESLLPDTLEGPSARPTPWHQDSSVVVQDADATEIITVWIPIFDATEENGCLRVVPRNHRQGLIEHCPSEFGHFLDTKFFDSDRAIPLPMQRGSVLFMTRNTPHSSLPNNSSEIRWSMDLRYNATGQPTGRPQFPGFVARSRRDPSSELADAGAWKRDWLSARSRLASDPSLIGRFQRVWDGTGCA